MRKLRSGGGTLHRVNGRIQHPTRVCERHRIAGGPADHAPGRNRTCPIPDVLVVRSAQPGRHWFAPAEVIFAVEIESPGSHLEDRDTKPALYARYGIPHYWRVELDPPLITTYEVGHGGRYRIMGPAATSKSPSRSPPRSYLCHAPARLSMWVAISRISDASQLTASRSTVVMHCIYQW
ncbi:MAG: Uma2 family endonuclease [Pseudonocardiaceae bacterium]